WGLAVEVGPSAAESGPGAGAVTPARYLEEHGYSASARRIPPHPNYRSSDFSDTLKYMKRQKNLRKATQIGLAAITALALSGCVKMDLDRKSTRLNSSHVS